MDDFEGWALASLNKAVARWEEGRVDMFCHHIEMAFTLLERHSREENAEMLFCPFCQTDTLSLRGNMWIHCGRCDRLHVENWIDDEDVMM